MQTQITSVTPQTDYDGCWDRVVWSDEFITGNAGIDDDHRRLLELFNEFSMAVNAGKSDRVVGGVLDELADYTHYHFAREELIMLENAYPGYERHKKMHDTFVRQVDDVRNHMSVGVDMSAFLLSFLAKWLSGHILGADQHLGRFLDQPAIEH